MITIQKTTYTPQVAPALAPAQNGAFGKTAPLETRAHAQFGLFNKPSAAKNEQASKTPADDLGILYYLLPKGMQDALAGGEFMVLQKGQDLFVMPIPAHGNGKTATFNLMA